MDEREELQKVMRETSSPEVELLNPELQSILTDDMLTVFHNRFTILRKIQEGKQKELQKSNLSVPESKWLSNEIKNIFNYEVKVLKTGLRLTKFTTKKKQ
jgi:hypothetical protein